MYSVYSEARSTTTSEDIPRPPSNKVNKHINLHIVVWPSYTLYNSIWMDIISHFLAVSEDVFGSNCSETTAAEWERIAKVQAARDNNMRRLVLFPTTADAQKGSLSNTLLDLAAGHSTTIPTMKMTMIDGLKMSTRRPSFLQVLDDDAYCKVFEALNSNPDRHTQWTAFSHMDSTLNKGVNQLLHHVLM